MICPRSLVLNGTFREFSDGFEELGIPKTGSGPPSPTFSLFLLHIFSILYGLLFLSTFRECGFGADSIKRLFVAAKRWVKRFVRGASRSPCPLSRPRLLLSSSPAFSVSLGAFRFLCSSPLCTALPQPEIYKRERAFQGRASGSFSNGNNLVDKNQRESRAQKVLNERGVSGIMQEKIRSRKILRAAESTRNVLF